ncbi:MAG: aspartyl protease family protein [Gloeobacteraceae cyanobacterium ES-bin-316]|nr:aspartyl protease family protein [Ferruginibacter sp.]
MRLNKILIFLFIFPIYASGQEIISGPPPSLITRFPFKQYSGGVMIIRACLENMKDSLNFILDTGSGGISLDSTTCAQYNIAGSKSDTTITGIGGRRKVSFVFNKTLHFPGLDVKGLNFHINNYDVLTSVYGERIDGVIGYSFFSRYIVKINFDSFFVEVFTPGKMQYPPRGHILKPVFTSLPIQFVQLRDSRRMSHHFYFDTGAGLCFLMSDRFAEDSMVLRQKRKPKLTQAEGMAGRVQMRLTVIKELKVGPYRFNNVPTYLYKDDYNVTSYPFAGGLLGNELLRRFNMTFNYGEREIHLLPNSLFQDPFDYAYTGLGIYYLDGKIVIEDVIPGSPSAKAGLQIGDEIFGVGNNLTQNIQQYKNMLQVANQKIRLLILREGKLLEITLKTSSIF